MASLLANSLLLLPTSAVGLAANAFVLLAVWRQKSLQTCNNALLVNLAVGDLLRCVVDCPLLLAVVVAVQHRGRGTPLLCDAQLAAFSFSCCVQLLTLACISVERHQAVSQPFRMAQRRRRLFVVIPATWVVAAAVAAVCLLYLKDSPVHVRCRGRHQVDAAAAASSYDTFGLYVLLPLWAACFAVITGFYAQIFALVRAHNRKIMDNGTFFTKADPAEDKQRQGEVAVGQTEEDLACSASLAPANSAKRESPAAVAAAAPPGVPDGSENGAEVRKELQITDLEEEQLRSSEDGAAAPQRLDCSAKTAEEQQLSNAGVKSERAKPQTVLRCSDLDPKSSKEGAETDKAPSEIKGSSPRVPSLALPERTGAVTEAAKSGGSGETPPAVAAATEDGASSLPPAAAAMQSIEVQGPVCMMPTKERKERASKSKESKMAKRAGYIIITFLLFWLPLVSSILANFIAHKNRNMQVSSKLQGSAMFTLLAASTLRQRALKCTFLPSGFTPSSPPLADGNSIATLGFDQCFFLQTALIQDLEILTVSVACVTSLSDPIIYAAVNPQFRTEFDRLRKKVESVFDVK